MSLAFETALELLFADPNLGRDVVYIADGGAPVSELSRDLRAGCAVIFGGSGADGDRSKGAGRRAALAPGPTSPHSALARGDG